MQNSINRLQMFIPSPPVWTMSLPVRCCHLHRSLLSIIM